MHGDQLVGGGAQRPLGVAALVADEGGGAADQHRVVDHQELRLEQRGGALAGDAGELGADLLELAARSALRLGEAGQLGTHAIGGDQIADVAAAGADYEGAALGDAGRDADAVYEEHADSSSKPRSTSAERAPTAASSSAPSALMVMEVPRAAASSSRPMMLLPSIVRPAAVDPDLRPERAGEAHESGGGAGVQAQAVADDDGAADHAGSPGMRRRRGRLLGRRPAHQVGGHPDRVAAALARLLRRLQQAARLAQSRRA